MALRLEICRHFLFLAALLPFIAWLLQLLLRPRRAPLVWGLALADIDIWMLSMVLGGCSDLALSSAPTYLFVSF